MKNVCVSLCYSIRFEILNLNWTSYLYINFAWPVLLHVGPAGKVDSRHDGLADILLIFAALLLKHFTK